MRSRVLFCVLAAFALSTLAPSCAPFGIQVESPEPEQSFETFGFEVLFTLGVNLEPNSLEVAINEVSILDRISGGPVSFSATIDFHAR